MSRTHGALGIDGAVSILKFIICYAFHFGFPFLALAGCDEPNLIETRNVYLTEIFRNSPETLFFLDVYMQLQLIAV